jgi:hypothetical protein
MGQRKSGGQEEVEDILRFYKDVGNTYKKASRVLNFLDYNLFSACVIPYVPYDSCDCPYGGDDPPS